MPTYQIDIPNQGTFEVSSDVELSEADVYKHALSQIDQEKPSEGLSAGDVAYGAVTNMPSSLAGVASDIYTAITNPFDTAYGLGSLVTGAVQSAGVKAGEAIMPEGKTKEEVLGWMKQDEKNTDMAGAVADYYAKRYGSMEGFKQAVATDPASVMADASTVLTGGAGLATKLGVPAKATQALKTAGTYIDPVMLAAKGTSKSADLAYKGSGLAAKQSLGMTTGAGPEAIGQAYKSGVEGGTSGEKLRGSMRGAVPIDEIVDIAKEDLLRMKINKNNQYKKNLDELGASDVILSFDGVDKALNKAENIVAFKGQVTNKRGYEAVSAAKDMVSEWKTLEPTEFHTPIGIDNLKQKIDSIIDDIPFEQKQARFAVTEIKTAIDKEIKSQAKGYAKMMSEYSSSAKLIKEIERALSLGDKAAADTSIRKLQSLMRNNASTNYGKRLDLAKTLEQEGGGQFMPLAAGQALQDWSPRGIQRGVAPLAGLGAYNLGGLPAAAAMASASSPRLVGELAHATGRAAGGMSRATQGILGMIPELDFQQALNLAYQSQQPKEQ